MPPRKRKQVSEGGRGAVNDSDEESDDERAVTKMPRAALKIVNINVSGINNPLKRRQLFAWLRENKIDVALLSETHLADNSKIPYWQRGWAPSAAAYKSWWSVSATPHTGGTAVLLRPSLQATMGRVEMDARENNGR